MTHAIPDIYFFRQKLILIFVFSFIFGILVSSFVFVSPLICVLVLVVAGAVYLSEMILYGRVRREVLVFMLVIISISLGSIRYNIKDFHSIDRDLESKVGSRVEFVGVVVSEPEARDNSNRFVLQSSLEKILVNADLYSDVSFGDEVKVEGKLERPSVIDDGVGRPFDYAKYLSKDDIYFTLSFADLEVLSRGNGSPLKSFLYRVKGSLVRHIREVLSEPHASLLSGLIVSGKDAMPRDILEEFRRAGVIHIVVLSGHNITIIAEFIRRMFERGLIAIGLTAFPQMAVGASAFGIIFFVLMTGAEAAVVRATIMVLVVMLAKVFGQNYSAPRALLGAAFLMVLHNPKILVFDPSFQLSFLATMALIYVVPIFERYLFRVTDKGGVRTVLATTLGTQVAVLPYLIYSMGEVSLVSLPANMLILVFIPVTMLVGFLATVISYFSIYIALPFAYFAHALLSWILGVSRFLGNLPVSSIKVEFFPIWLVLVCYIFLIWFVYSYNKKLERSKLESQDKEP